MGQNTMNQKLKIPAGRLYISGHAAGQGYAIERQWSDKECSITPAGVLEERIRSPRLIASRDHAQQLVQRWNRRFASH